MTTTGQEPRCGCGAVNPASARFCAWCGDRLGPTATFPEERRTTTALFADLSNFSWLVATLDTEELLTLVDPVLNSLGGIVERHGGRVEKFAGDALLALFGAPVAHEEDPERAVQAALAMHAYVAGADVPPLAQPWSLHIGIATGPVIGRTIGSSSRSDYAVLGEAVVLAQRLQGAAGAGETFLDATTVGLVRADVAVESLGELTLKGRDQPTPAFRVSGLRAPGSLAADRLVGRDHELAQLLAALDDARSGATTLRLLTGPAGSGKSQLLAHLRGHAEELGVPAVELVASPFAAQPYGALRPLVERAVRRRSPNASSDAARLEELAATDSAPASPALTAILLGLADAAQPGPADRSPAVLRQELRAAALAWWRDLGVAEPLLVTIDNAQWLDSPSAEVVAALSDAEPTPVLVCLASRDVDGSAVPAATPVELSPLSREAVAELIANELDLTPAVKLVDLLVERGAGNPMTVRESVRQLLADDLLDVHHGHARLVSGVAPSTAPAALTALLSARIDASPPATVGLATVAAVVGPSSPVALLTAVSGGQEPNGSVGDLEAIGWGTVEGTSFRFASPLLREVLYDRLTSRRRRELHGRVAAVVATDPSAPPALLAEHLYLSGDSARALPVLREVAAQARRLFDHDTAARALDRAVRSARSAAPEQVPALLCEVGDVRIECGEYEGAESAYAEAVSSGNDSRAWSGLAGARRRSGDHQGAVSLLDEALASRPRGDLRLIWCELAWAHSVAGRLEASRAAADRGLALSSGDDAITARLLLQRVRVTTLLGELGAAAEDADRAVSVLEREDDTAGLCTALRLLGDLRLQRGESEQAVATLERGLETAERAGLIEEQGGCLINLGLIHGGRGAHGAASEAYARAAVVFEQAGHTAGCATAYGNRAYELFMLGNLDAAQALGQRALDFAGRIEHHLALADVNHTLGLIAERSGDPVSARRHAGRAIEEFEAAGVPAAAAASRDLAARVTADPAQWNEMGQGGM